MIQTFFEMVSKNRKNITRFLCYLLIEFVISLITLTYITIFLKITIVEASELGPSSLIAGCN